MRKKERIFDEVDPPVSQKERLFAQFVLADGQEERSAQLRCLLASVRSSLGLTQAEFAELVGRKQSAIGRSESSAGSEPKIGGLVKALNAAGLRVRLMVERDSPGED